MCASSSPAVPAAEEARRALEAGDFDRALVLAQRLVEGTTSCLPSHGLLALVLLRLGRLEEMRQVIAQAEGLGTGIADAYDGLGFVAVAAGDLERASALYGRAIQLAPREPRFWYNLACSERGQGKLADAEAACDRAIAADPAQYPSYLLRSELRVQSPAANHVRELEHLLARHGGDYRAELFLGYALAKELDDLDRFDEAFAWFARSAGVRRSRLQYDVKADEAKLERIAAVYSRELLARMIRGDREPGADRASRHIFIVGLPRSGTTLVERILTGLAGVRSNGETDHFSRALFAAARGSGDVFERAAAADPEAIAAGYARLAEPGASASHIVEKLPLNYLYAGAILRALPEARIVLVSRAPLDSCFAMFRTLFGAGYPFSYDLAELGRYYAAYARLVEHWRTVLGSRLHEIVYEDLVREPKRIGAAAARYCGIEWRDVAVEIEKNRSVSLTASAAQVRRPIYGSSSGRWRYYRRHLEPLLATLRARGLESLHPQNE
jgi:tetratricopeptide (TPR) repeat protein